MVRLEQESSLSTIKTIWNRTDHRGVPCLVLGLSAHLRYDPSFLCRLSKLGFIFFIFFFFIFFFFIFLFFYFLFFVSFLFLLFVERFYVEWREYFKRIFP